MSYTNHSTIGGSLHVFPYCHLWEHVETLDSTQSPLLRRIGEQNMRSLWHVYIVNLEDDTVFEETVIARDESFAKLKAVEEARKDFIELAEVSVDDMDILAFRLGSVRE